MTRQRQLILQSALDEHSSVRASLSGGSSNCFGLQRAPRSSASVLGFWGLLALSGCSADPANSSRLDQTAGANNGSSGGPTVDTSCLSDAFTVCVTCHYSTAAPNLGAGLDLQSPGVAARLVNVAATHVGATGTCPAAKLIDTASPMASWLLVKVNGKQGDCGNEMPLIGNPLSAAQLACLEKFASDEAAVTASSSGGRAAGTGGT